MRMFTQAVCAPNPWAIMGGLRVPGAVSSENWPCESKGGFVSSKVRGFQMEQNLKSKHEHGAVAAVPVT